MIESENWMVAFEHEEPPGIQHTPIGLKVIPWDECYSNYSNRKVKDGLTMKEYMEDM